MSKEWEDFLKIAGVLVPLILGIPIYFTLKHQIQKLVAEALASRKKADLDEASTAKIYADLAKDAGESLAQASTEVKTAETRIATLEKLVVDLNRRLSEQEADKTRLEEEVKKRDEKIEFLQERVTVLEKTLEANHIEIPPAEVYKNAKT